MNDYAVVKIGNKQYIVEPDQTYTVDKFAGEEGTKVDLEVLARGKGEDFEIGKPLVEKTKVTVEILTQGAGEKVVAKTYKAKSRYHRTKGFRKPVTTFKVVSIK